MIARRLKLSALAAIVSFSAVGAAKAADMTVPALAPAVDFSAWHLRGDVGFNNQQVGNLFNKDYSRFESVTNDDKRFNAAAVPAAAQQRLAASGTAMDDSQNAEN